MRPRATEIVGRQQRFDQRDSIFPRTAAGLETDKKIRAWADLPVHDPGYRMLMGIPRSENCVTYYLANAVDGPVNPQRSDLPAPAILTEEIKGFARFLGADHVGVAALNQAYVASHRADEYMTRSPEYGTPIHLQHPYAVSMVFKRDYHLVKAANSFIDGCEGALSYNKAAVAACQLAGYIRELGYGARAHHEREEQVLQIPIAVEAGNGELGRLGLLITGEWGPRVRISTVTTDLPLVPDVPVDLGVGPVCELCRKCARACPSQAIPRGEQVVVRGVRKWVIDPRKCLAFWGHDKQKRDDCSACIAACPYNRPDSWFNRWHRKPWFFRLIRRRFWGWVMLLLDDLIRGRRPKWKVRWLGRTNY